MWISDKWKDYEILETSGGEKLERWGDYYLVRPDPQVIWDIPHSRGEWSKPHGHYHRSNRGGGEWEFHGLPEVWSVNYRDLTFLLKPMNFKHTGLFPEQAVNWDWMRERITAAGRSSRILNLFAYTGGATVAAAKAGAAVTHVDAARGMVSWAKENAAASGLKEAPVRYLVDDCDKFVQREIRRGNRYDAIILDPPSYGRGPGGETWKIETSLYPFLIRVVSLLSDNPLFVLLNSYTTGLQPATMAYLLNLALCERFPGSTVTADEIGIPVSSKTGVSSHKGSSSDRPDSPSRLILPCGATARWTP